MPEPSASVSSVERHLAAILAADIVGYSRLMGEDEEATVRDVKRRFADCTRRIKAFGGRVVGTAGDGMICEFASAVRAVQCAIGLHKIMAHANRNAAADRQMLLRIGINLGDVVRDEQQIYGDGVNIAARLEAMAEPGGLCISRDAHNQVRDKLPYAFGDLGEHSVKNIVRPVRVFALSREALDALPMPDLAPHRSSRRLWASAAGVVLAVLLVAGLYFSMRGAVAPAGLPATAAVAASRPAIAVLPFASLSGDGNDAYLVDGLTEDVIAALGRFPELPVLSRGAVFPYKGTSRKLTEVGAELGARYVVEGSVRRSADEMRVAVQLSDAADGKLLWSDQYKAEPKNVLGILDAITRDIAGSLAIRLTRLEQARVAAKPPSSLEAYDLVLRGRDLGARMQRLANTEAQAMFEQALALDPNNVTAFVGLGQVELTAAAWGWREDPIGALEKAESYAQKALAITEEDGGAHALLGNVYALSRRLDRAIEELRRAVQLNPSDADNYQDLAEVLLSTGDAAGSIEAAELALHFNPNLSSGGLATLGLAYFLVDRRTDARAVLEKAVARNPRNFVAFLHLAAVHAVSGQAAEAASALAAARALNPTLDPAGIAAGLQTAEHRAKFLAAIKLAGN